MCSLSQYPGIPSERDVVPAMTDFETVTDGEISSLLYSYNELCYCLISATVATLIAANTEMPFGLQVALWVFGFAVLPYAYMVCAWRVENVTARQILCYVVAAGVGLAAAHQGDKDNFRFLFMALFGLAPVLATWVVLYYAPIRNRFGLLTAVALVVAAVLALFGQLAGQLFEYHYLLVSTVAVLCALVGLQLKVHLRRRGRADACNESLLYTTTLFFVLFLLRF